MGCLQNRQRIFSQCNLKYHCATGWDITQWLKLEGECCIVTTQAMSKRIYIWEIKKQRLNGGASHHPSFHLFFYSWNINYFFRHGLLHIMVVKATSDYTVRGWLEGEIVAVTGSNRWQLPWWAAKFNTRLVRSKPLKKPPKMGKLLKWMNVTSWLLFITLN